MPLLQEKSLRIINFVLRHLLPFEYSTGDRRGIPKAYGQHEGRLQV